MSDASAFLAHDSITRISQRTNRISAGPDAILYLIRASNNMSMGFEAVEYEEGAFMIIQITQPEIEALIQQRLTSGTFRDAEDVILQALRSSQPETHPVRCPADAGQTVFEQGLGLFGSPDDAALLDEV